MLTYHGACFLLGIDPADFQSDPTERQFTAFYTVIYRLRGLLLNEPTDDVPVLNRRSSHLLVRITRTAREELRSIAEQECLANLMMGVFAGQFSANDIESKLVDILAEFDTTRADETSKETYLVCSVSQTLAGQFTYPRRSFTSFSVGFNIVSMADLAAKAQHGIAQAIAILAAAGTELSQLDLVGNSSYIIDEHGAKYYSSSPSMSASGYTSAPLSDEQARRITQYNNLSEIEFPSSAALELLSRSLFGEQDRSRRFLLAWTSLEILINTTFSAQRQALFQKFAEDVPDSPLAQFLERLKAISDGKFTLHDRFLGLLAYIGCTEWQALSADFLRLKEIRDRYFHRMSVSDKDLPMEDAIKLAIRILRDYLNFVSQRGRP